jgi:hypothetical protein
VHDLQSRNGSELFAFEARKREPYPDSATSGLRIGYLQRPASPHSPYSVAQKR